MRQAVFTIECTCRIIAQGLFFGRGLKIPMHARHSRIKTRTAGDAPNPCYLKEPSNWIDMMVVRSLAELWILGSSLSASTNKVIFTFVEPFAAEAPAPSSARHDVDVERSALFKLSLRELGSRA